MTTLLDTEGHLRTLKDFQRRTVDYVFRRMYVDDAPARRFLVADEVGLGKTMVARGLIARAIEWLDQRGVGRIDVVYVCSNAAIAAQNLARLDVLPPEPGRAGRQTSYATRLTLLPLHVRGLKANRVNFVSFTPGTTFDLRSRGGTLEERAVLHWMLRGAEGVDGDGLRSFLRGSAGWVSWDRERCRWEHASEGMAPDGEITADFRAAVTGDEALLRRVVHVAERFAGQRGDVSRRLNEARLALVGDLRMRLAGVCLDALEPDVVILDEFQRFKHLLDPSRGEAELAQRMFNYPGKDGDPPPRVLLLSATPYKMYTVAGEVDDDHYADFVATLEFLHEGDCDATAGLKRAVGDYRRALRRIAAAPNDEAAGREVCGARDRVQELLLRVMVRTERVSTSRHRDAMVAERIETIAVRREDLRQAVTLDRVARAVGAPDVIDYWKSAPYLLNFMKDYDLKRRLDRHVEGRPDAVPPSGDLIASLRAARPDQLQLHRLERYAEVAPGNGRLRALVDALGHQELWRLLWLPPSLAYLEPGGAYAAAAQHTTSKALVFSAWNVVPDAIAAVTSYESERRMLASIRDLQSYGALTRERRGLLRFAVSRTDAGERYAGMGALLLLYPSPWLASFDPLRLATEAGHPVPPEQAIADLEQRIARDLEGLEPSEDVNAHGTDARWYWVALAHVDGARTPGVAGWLTDSDRGAPTLARRATTTHGDTGFERVLERFAAAMATAPPLGRRPPDLARVLAEVALGAPGVCALRSLGRQTPSLAAHDPQLLQAAAQIAEGFRTMFNVPETMGLLGAWDVDAEDYWRRCVQHGIEGNLQAVLDEHTHTLSESLGLAEAPPERLLPAIGGAVADALSIRTANLYVDDLRPKRGGAWLKRDRQPFAFRTRFGLRLGDFQDESRQVHRVDVVRKAFNSPFRPFVLASTSVGQEGLDFHTWCHVVYHWNLPTNPVDMEQREGRVHRYKGLAVRRNVARAFGLTALGAGWSHRGDPWSWMFEQARATRSEGRNDMVPFWLYDEVDDPVRVERRVPMLHFSQEERRYQALKRSLALYRLAFGQPRQEDLLAWLEHALGSAATELVDGWRIDLSAPG